MQSLNAKFLKQMVLRSALDPPEVYSQVAPADYSTIRNIGPDNLQLHLRDQRRKNNYWNNNN